MSDAFRIGLNGVLDLDTESFAIPQNPLKGGLVVRGGYHEDLANTRQHEGGERVIDQRLVVHRNQLFADAEGDRVEPGPRSARQDDPLHLNVLLRPIYSRVRSVLASHARSSAQGRKSFTLLSFAGRYSSIT